MEEKIVVVVSKPCFNYIMDRYEINDDTVEGFGGSAYISINDTEGEWKESYFNKDHSNVIRLWFDDVSPGEATSPTNKISVSAMTEEQGKQIINFIERNKEKIKFVVHCTAGISRSGAVGAFISDYFGLDYSVFMANNPMVRPNAHISRTLNNIMRTR